MLHASNGTSVSAMKIFSITLRYFRDHAIQELRDATGTKLGAEDIRWVVTVPAIWRQEAKQFMREAAYQVNGPMSEAPWLQIKHSRLILRADTTQDSWSLLWSLRQPLSTAENSN